MQSVRDLHDLLVRKGVSPTVAQHHAASLSAHAMVCRARADAPLGPFRDFVAVTGRMTRYDGFLGILKAARRVPRLALVTQDARSPTDNDHADVRRAACEALHDLIMEGV